MKMLKKGEKVRGEGGMCTKNGSYCEKEKKVSGGGGQGRCERRSEAFVKIQKKKLFSFFFWGGGEVRVAGGGGGGGRGGGGGGGVRVDVNLEVKLL